MVQVASEYTLMTPTMEFVCVIAAGPVIVTLFPGQTYSRSVSVTTVTPLANLISSPLPQEPSA